MTDTLCAPLRPLFHRRGLYALFGLLLCLFRAAPAAALPPQELILDPPAVQLEKGMLTVKLAVAVDNEEGLLALLKDGAVLELAVKADVERERSFWSNATAGGAEFSSIVRHDPLSRDFVVTTPTVEGHKEIRDRNLARLLQASWHRLSLPVARLADLLRDEPAEAYLILLSISLRHTEVPPWLEKSSVLWSSDVVPPLGRSFVFTLPQARAGARQRPEAQEP